MKRENVNIKDLTIKIILIVIIIILLIHNCTILKSNQNQNNVPRSPNGNVDIIEIRCDSNKCVKDDKQNNGLKPTEKTITNISFAQSNYSIKVGESVNLIAIIKPTSLSGSTLTWESDNPNVATVAKNGKVKGISEGMVTITVKSSNGQIATCTISVTKNIVNAEKIILNPTKATINVGSSIQISAIVEPEDATNGNLIWSSSDKSVATVSSDGIVTGLSLGVAKITVKTADGTVVATSTITVDNDDDSGNFKVYDQDYTPVTWNGSTDLKIFTRSIYNVDGFIAPESENTYEFIVKNSTEYTLKYKINFIETNVYGINMKYKLKKNDTYIVDHYVSINEIDVDNVILDSDEHTTYYLEWKWISSSNDTGIGTTPDASYKLQIDVKAESVNE